MTKVITRRIKPIVEEARSVAASRRGNEAPVAAKPATSTAPVARNRNGKVYTQFRPQIRSRHPSHNCLRNALPRVPFPSVIRFGSTTELPDTIDKGGKRVEVNTTDAVRISSNKLLMKQAFDENEVKTAIWTRTGNAEELRRFFNEHGQIVAKSFFGSRGEGNTLISSMDELNRFILANTINNFVFEKYYNYVREYRLHVTAEGMFYTCRKMLKRDTPEGERWYRNDSNCVWIVEENEDFDRPACWDAIVEQSVAALNAVGLDIGAVDVKVQSNTKNGTRRQNVDFIILEINSAPSFGERTEILYKEELMKVLNAKYNASK